MYDNILRKITSLSILAILLTSTAVMGIPSVIPAAHAQVASHPNLFVSAEMSQYNNYFAGPQVIQVIVSDPSINQLNQAYGEPVVTVSGKRLRMFQATDGNWYGYFADRNQAEFAGKTAPVAGEGLNFGYFCDENSNVGDLKTGLSFTDTKGFTLARNPFGNASSSISYSGVGANPASPFLSGFPQGGGLSNVCDLTTAISPQLGATTEHVIRENKTLNTNPSGYAASQLLEDAWPIIQLYDFSGIPQSVVVDYAAAGGDQTVNLTFDRIPSNLISVTTDRTSYPENAAVFLTMNDPQLNVDPTEDDIWTWGANPTNNTLFYQAWDRNGLVQADGAVGDNISPYGASSASNVMQGETDLTVSAMQNLIGNLTNFNFNHNGAFTFQPGAKNVVDFQTFGRDKLACNTGLANGCDTTTRGLPSQVQDANAHMSVGSEMITFAEQGGVNTGVFGDWDGSRVPAIVMLNPSEEAGFTIGSNAYPAQGSIRGLSATYDYNEISGSIVGGFSFGSVTMTATNGTWASGTRIPVTLTDNNANTNSKLIKFLNFYDPTVSRITAMKIGTPFTLDIHNPSAPPETAGILGTLTNTATAPALTAKGAANNGIYTVNGVGAQNATSANIQVDEQFSSRPIFQFANGTQSSAPSIPNNGILVISTGGTMQELLNTINDPLSTNPLTNTATPVASKFRGFDLFNYDVRSFGSLNGATGQQIATMNIYLVNSTGPIMSGNDVLGANSKVQLISLVNNTSNLQGFVNLNGTQVTPGGQASTTSTNDNLQVLKNIFSVPPTNYIGLAFQFNNGGGETTISSSGEPVAADFFSIGILGDGTTNAQRINNAIYRWELQETGANTGVFTGSNQFTMLNQIDIFDPQTYANLRTINHDVLFVAIQDMLASEARAPQASYLDLGADGVNTPVSAQQDIPTNSGTVTFDQTTYKVGDTVTVTVTDPDLNTNNDLVVIYSSVQPVGTLNTLQDPATDTVGLGGLGVYTDGTPFGRLLDIQFGQADTRWSNANESSTPQGLPGPCFGGNVLTDNNNTGDGHGFATSLSASGFSLVETAAGSGIFTGTFEIPGAVCQIVNGVSEPTTSNGLNMKVNYVDFRDQSGELVVVSDNAGIRGNTGSVKLDKSVYPVPFGTVGTSDSTPNANFGPSAAASVSSLNGVFPLHRDLSGNGLDPTSGPYAQIPLVLPAGVVQVHARVNDPDYTTAATGTNYINVPVFSGTLANATNGPVAFQISRGSDSVLLATAGGPKVQQGKIVDLGGVTLPPLGDDVWSQVPDLGPMAEITPGAGIFQANLPIEMTDGPPSTSTAPCPSPAYYDGGIDGTGFAAGASTRFAVPSPHTHLASPPTTLGTNYCVREGDVLTVTYYDTANAAGQPETVTDSATFDLRNGVLQSDKSVYIIGSDMILTLVEPDLNLDSQTAETLPLDLIEWDSHAYKGTMGPLADKTTAGVFEAFDAQPSTFVETGKDTGIFQAVIKIPEELGTTLLERGEEINLEYTDWGPAGSKTVGSNSQDIELTVYTSNFGATVELDQKVYTWTDLVYITVVAPDHNFDPNLIDTIGLTDEDQVIVSTRGNQIYYKLSETGVDTGIFTGYVILTGDPTLKGATGVDGAGEEPTGLMGDGTNNANDCTASNPCGPTDGFLPAENQDGVSVSFEFTRDQTVTGSALIQWNIGEVSWLQSSYPANGQGVLQIVDPDMNLNPKAVDTFATNVWSDSDAGGIKLTMTETGVDTGIFQGTVYFTTNFQSSGNRLHVSQGDTVTGEYDDQTLPPPYTTSDDLRLTATTFIGTVVPPLERAPATNPRIVDSFGNAINGTVKTGQQIQVTADLANGQSTDQPFAYLVQIQDANGVTVSLSWITGTLSAGQSLNPAQSWTPSAAGTYTAQIFVWQSISNPNALSPPLSTTITVQ